MNIINPCRNFRKNKKNNRLKKRFHPYNSGNDGVHFNFMITGADSSCVRVMLILIC